MKQKILGSYFSGSLTDGFMMRINPIASLETIKTGKFVSIVGITSTFFSLITDLQLEVAHPDILLFPPHSRRILLQEFINAHGYICYRNLAATAHA